MKTAIKIPNALLKSATQLAQRNQTTMRAVVEDGLRRVPSDQPANAKPAFKLNDASVRGKVMLIPDPRRWQEIKAEHVVSQALKNFK